jgi:hypothetical protein
LLQVFLYAGSIPYLGWIAEHLWFEIHHDGKLERWEVWQLASQCPSSWGYLHKNLLPCGTWLNQKKPRQLANWQGSQAQQLARVIQTSKLNYPSCYHYRYWPGPNSNSYVQYILNQVDIDFPLGRKALGKGYRT